MPSLNSAMSLRLDILRPETARLFGILAATPELAPFTLIGGTALALQIGHRVSLDFDFAVFGGTLPGVQIDRLIERLKEYGCQTRLITSPAQTSAFKINTGLRLLDYARDYVVDGVKLTFFVHGKNPAQQAYYRDAPRHTERDVTFSILGLEGLQVAKTLVLADRVRSRDLYDLFVLTRDHGFTMESLFDIVTRLGTVDDPEHYKAVMRGDIPLDRDDEGLEAVDLSTDMSALYQHFERAIGGYEIRRSRDYFAARTPSVGPNPSG